MATLRLVLLPMTMVAVPDNTAADDAVMLRVIVTELVAVQPFAPVTVTVYVPVAVAVKSAIVLTTELPSLQE
jgi:hypothetical protein